MRLPISLLALMLPLAAHAQVAQYTATPESFRSVVAHALKAGAPAQITCAPGQYPNFLRSGAAYAGFKETLVLKCAGAVFPGASVSDITRVTLDGGTFTGRLILANCGDVAVLNATFPPGSVGAMARSCTNVLVQGNTVQASGAPLAFIHVKGLRVLDNTITDYSGNAGIAAYAGGDILIKGNLVAGSRSPPEGVHPDGIQTADYDGARQTGTVEISDNVVRYVGQGIFGGGTPDHFKAFRNYVMVDYPNGITWKARVSAEIGGNIIGKLRSPRTYQPRFVNFGLREGFAPAVDRGGNSVNGAAVTVQ